MKIKYKDIAFRDSTLAMIRKCNEIIALYEAQGFVLTLRQLYYQLVSRDIIANKQTEYGRLGSIVNDARLAGLIDWEMLEDRTRNLRALSHWESPESIVQSCAYQYKIDKWARQPLRVEVWIEKDALSGVFATICNELDIPYFSCRGYTSQSEMWSAGQRIARRWKGYRTGIAGTGPTLGRQKTIILHFGDHDPSGIDMSRDIADRLAMFCGTSEAFELRRLALNFDQVENYNPPPNPAKQTDSRFESYLALHGDESWELDALEPAVLTALVRDEVESLRDDDEWNAAESEETKARRHLQLIATNFDHVVEHLDGTGAE